MMRCAHERRSFKVLIACEISGVVRNAFLFRGYDAWSCDLLPADDNSNRHVCGDVRDVLNMDDWNLLIVAHPPCTRLCNSGVHWLSNPPLGRTREDMWRELEEGAALFSDLLNAPVPRAAMTRLSGGEVSPTGVNCRCWKRRDFADEKVFMSVRILIGDVFDRIRELADESIHCIVTSPHYLFSAADATAPTRFHSGLSFFVAPHLNLLSTNIEHGSHFENMRERNVR